MAFEIFATNAQDLPHWTLNSCSGAFHNIWVHLGPFGYCMKQGANRAELVQLMQKFVQRSRIGMFCNKGTRSIPLHPKLMFWSISYVWVHLGTFRYCMRLCANRAELVQLMQKFVQRSGVTIFRNEDTPSIPLVPNLMFWCVL